MSYTHRVLNTRFTNWLEDEIYISKGLVHAPRKYVIMSFVEDLRTYIESGGYAFSVAVKEMSQEWARYLFRIQHNMRKNLTFQRNPDERAEDYDWFSHKFDYENTMPFVNHWVGCDDFGNNPSILQDAFMFAWYFVDINASSETRKVDELIGDSESEEDASNPQRRIAKKNANGDPYLEDQANATSKYNRWD